jgi:hypothetical protein
MQHVFDITLDYRETSLVSTPSSLVYSGTQLFLSSKIQLPSEQGVSRGVHPRDKLAWCAAHADIKVLDAKGALPSSYCLRRVQTPRRLEDTTD